MKIIIALIFATTLLTLSGCQTATDPSIKLTHDGLQVRRVVLTSPDTDWLVVEILTYLAREEYGEPLATGWVWLDDIPKSDWRVVEVTATPQTQALITRSLINYRGHMPNQLSQLEDAAQ